MDASRRARPQVESFEDRVVPSRVGFDHGPGPVQPDGPRAAIVRDHPHGFDHAGPYVGSAPARRGPDVSVVVVRAAARTEPAAAERVAPLVVAAMQADPEPAATAAYLPPAEPRPALGTTPLPAPPPAAAGVLVDAAAAGLRAAAFTTTALTAAATDDAVVRPEGAPSPAAPEPTPLPPVTWEFPPLLVELPGAVPLAGVFGVDLIAVEAGVRQALDAAAELVPVPADGWGADGWLMASAALLGGAGWAAARARRPRPTPDAVFLGWGECDDRRRG
ncbi:MAG: hypothetical protein U0804_09985 [Gemmataceae bacterium]